MAVDPNIINLCNQLAQAVEITLSPDVPQQERLEAYTACENFKENSPMCVQCGVYLSANGSHLARHFGLQLLEYSVKYKWYHINQDEKRCLKGIVMNLLEDGDFVIGEYTHLKDALSRVVVEMAKREWPQHWPELFPELFRIAFKDFTQAELVLFILLRLIEDVAVLQKLESPQRRKDLHQSLVIQLDGIFSFIISVMEKYYELTLSKEINQSVRVVKLGLLTLCEFMEWAPIARILADDGKVLHILSILILNENFQLEASDCFLQILSRKGKYEEMKLIATSFFNTNVIDKFSQLNFMLDNGVLTERNYSFVKKVSEIIFSVSTLLCGLLDKSENSSSDTVERTITIDKFETYLKILLSLCNHYSFTIIQNAVSAWNAFFRHKLLRGNSYILKYIPQWINIITPKLIKIPYPSTSTCLLNPQVSKYILLDFDCQQSYHTFFYHYRTEIISAYKHLATFVPDLCFRCVEQWMNSNIQKTLPETICVIESNEYLQWEAQIFLMKAIFSHFSSTYMLPIDNGLRLIDACVNLKTEDPVIMSFVLSCLSSLLIFITNASNEINNLYLPRIVEKIFISISFEIPGETKLTRSKTVRSLRQHAGSLLIKISTKYPLLLLPLFDHIRCIFHMVKNEVNKFSKTETLLLLETVIILSNHLNNFQRQNEIIKPILSEIEQYWNQTCLPVFEDYNKFMSYVGLNVDPLTTTGDDMYSSNRMKLMFCLDTILAIINRAACPDEQEKAIQGGFVVAYSENGIPICCNPATPCLLPFISGIFLLVKILNSLWTEEARSKLPAMYKKVYDLSELERKLIIGGPGIEKTDIYPCLEQSTNISVTYMQTYLITIYEHCFMILTKCSTNLKYSFFNLPNFAPSFTISVFCHINSIPDYRLRMMMKIFLKNFINSCPPEKYDIVLLPIIQYFTEHMLERLTYRWRYLSECRENGILNENISLDDEECNSKEMLENLVITQLTREHIDIIRNILFVQRAETKRSMQNADTEEGNSLNGSQTNLNQVISDSVISELGTKSLSVIRIRNSIISVLLQAISWNDSSTSLKIVSFITLILKFLMTDSTITSELAVQFMVSLLQGLEVHGEHDGNVGGLLNAAVMCYELLRPIFTEVLEVMKMVPSIDLEELKKFDEKVFTEETKNKVEKGKKEKFRKLINQLIGRNIGQLFKRKEQIRDLPRIEVWKAKGDDIINRCNHADEIGISNFFK